MLFLYLSQLSETKFMDCGSSVMPFHWSRNYEPDTGDKKGLSL